MKRQTGKKEEALIKKPEEKYKAMFEFSPEAVAFLDMKGTILDVNDKMCEWLGYKREEIIGKHILEQPYLTVEGRTEAAEKFSQRIGGNEIPPYELDFVTNKGEKRVGLVTAIPMEEKGEITGELALVSDITERKRIEEELKNSEKQLKILFEYAPDAYYLNDLKGTFIDGNRIAEEITGYKREELIGQNFLKLNMLPKKLISKAATSLARNALGLPTGPDEFLLNRKDGSQITAEISTYPVKIKDKTVVLGIARDITKRKKIEQELKKQKDLVDQTNKELTRKVEELQDALKHIKRLEGLIPICANCKKIRLEGKEPDDPKSWRSLESYITDKTDANLTHGLCPDCVKKLYKGKLD